MLTEDPDHFGLLVSNDVPELGVLAVDRDSASLFSRLWKPGHLPIHDCDPIEVARLVLDGILEVEWNGRFVTGPAAYCCLFTQPPEQPDAIGLISALSFAALKCVQEIPFTDPRAIASWLYSFNSFPMSPLWARRFTSQDRINNTLGLYPGGPVQAILDDDYIVNELPGWRAWQSLIKDLSVNEDEPTFKLYVSPHPSVLPEAFPIVIRCFAEARVPAFKLGMDVFGLLRPDKLIAYFSEYNAMAALAASLAKALTGCPAHGVPFTAAVDGEGLLSWGMDPPQSERIPGWRGFESWRVWVTDRLARAILRAKALENGGIEPWHYALTRLCLEGVQIQTWLPNIAMWAH